MKQSGPTGFQFGEFAPSYAARQEFRRGRLQPRLGRNAAFVELLETLAPPGELDCSNGGLASARDNVTHCVIYREQSIEGGTQFHRPVKPDEVAIPHSSGNRRPLRRRRRQKP